MDDRTVERVESWKSRPLSGGGDLHRLAEEEFSGALAAGGGWLFMLNGRVVGIVGGEMEQFADATAYEAPDPSLPLLFAMEETGGERRGEYYTGDTPVSEVDETLSEGSFTGYLCLSENVYSGDYYLVYYGGRAMPVGFVGSERRLVTGGEARESAEEEVGIYEVVSVSIDVQDVPEPEEETTGTGTGTGAAVGTGAADAGGNGGATDEDDSTGAGDTDAAEAATDETEPAVDTKGDRTEPAEAAVDIEDEETEPADATVDVERSEERSDPETADPEEPTPAAGTSPETSPEPRSRAANSETAVFEDEERWRKTRTIPALDPEQSEAADAGGEADVTPDARPTTSEAEPQTRPTTDTDGSADDEQNGALDAELADRERRIEELESRAEELERRAGELADERDELQAEVDRLEDRVGELTAERNRLQEQLDERGDVGGDTGEREKELAPDAALEGTNLFTRPESKSQPTLGDALQGDASMADARANLAVTRHTEFDESAATVAGDPYEQFLQETLEYRFVEWVVTDLPVEISETGREPGLADLYAALPEVDRADLRGTVEVDGEDGEPVSRRFDVVLRDRMGDPLVVAEFNPGRDPVETGRMTALVEDTTAVAESGVAAAFYVTASFFEPGALDATEEATKDGLLSRSSKENFVNVSRKRGFHLCLVESRDGSFYVSAPEL
jgi:regulator of replication initiation timing